MSVLARGADREAGRLRAAWARGGDGPNTVATVGEEAAELGPVRGGAADLRWPNPGRDQDSHGRIPALVTLTSVIAAARRQAPTCGPLCPRRLPSAQTRPGRGPRRAPT